MRLWTLRESAGLIDHFDRFQFQFIALTDLAAWHLADVTTKRLNPSQLDFTLAIGAENRDRYFYNFQLGSRNDCVLGDRIKAKRQRVRVHTCQGADPNRDRPHFHNALVPYPLASEFDQLVCDRQLVHVNRIPSLNRLTSFLLC